MSGNQTQLNETQLMLLKLFSNPMSDAELQALRTVLLNFYDERLQTEVAKAINEKQITQADLDVQLNRAKRK
jgi:hypothetical protein